MNKAFRTLNSLQCGQLLQTITSSQARRQGQQLHAHMLSSNVLFHNTYLNTKLAAMYAACGCMAEARTLFDRITLKSSFLWNVMVRGCACNRMPLDALALYRDMVAFGKRADNYTYPFVLKACGDLSLIRVGKRIHCEIVTCGYESDVYVGNSLLWMYSKFGELGIVGSLFDRMPEQDLTSWNTIISGYAKNGELEKALSVFSVMVRNGVRLDRATLLSVLPACADLMALRKGKEVHAYVLRTCMEFDAFLENAVIDVYMNSNFLMGARRLFERMDKRDIVSWNSMIFGCARCGDGVESINLFRKMNFEGLVPDIVTVIAVLGACERIAALQFGRGLHGYVAKKGFDKDVALGTALVDMYAKCGSVTSSRQIFNEMPKRNLISWSTMISGYGLHGQGREAISCLSQMKKEGVRPDAVTFTSALSACSHAGLVTEGKKIFQQMSNEYSITPKVEHYSCMVDLFGRAGKLDEAYDVIKNMEVKPNVDVWAALLSACRVHRNVELAEIAAQNAFHLKPEFVGLYVSLSNIYAVERRWDDVERAREQLQDRMG